VYCGRFTTSRSEATCLTDPIMAIDVLTAGFKSNDSFLLKTGSLK
jgi:hypothetical protein